MCRMVYASAYQRLGRTVCHAYVCLKVLQAVCEAYYILSNDSLRSLYDTNGVTPASIFRAEGMHHFPALCLAVVKHVC